MTEYERALWAGGAEFIAGVDEVGRGPLAGPVVAAAVILPVDFQVLGVDDSKKLSEKKREALFAEIRARAVAWGFGSCDNRLIDEINILEATKRAMEMAVRKAEVRLKERMGGGAAIAHVLIDALTLPGIGTPQTGIIKGDEKSVSIASASILAKVARDRLMRAYHIRYPAYAFDKNKGYGTKLHYDGLKKAGLSPVHRRSFCGNISF
jgi:ribonuclease HII